MLSFEEVSKRLFAYLHLRFRHRLKIDPDAPLDRYLPSEKARLRLIESVNKLPWVVLGRMQLPARDYLTLAAVALALYRSQPRTTRGWRQQEGKPRTAKKAKKAAKKGVKKAAKKTLMTPVFSKLSGEQRTAPKKAPATGGAGRPRLARGIRYLGRSFEPNDFPELSHFREPHHFDKLYKLKEGSGSDGAVSSPAPPGPPPPPVEIANDDAATRKDLTYTVWFGTSRQPNDASDYRKGFSGKRDTQIHFGFCNVFVPESHLIGSTGSRWWKRLLKGVDDRLKLTNIKGLKESKFWEGVKSELQRLRISDREAVIFIHGYNVSFEDAALRAAQLGTDLSVRGCMAFFSWPSRGKTSLYANDEATIEASEAYIAQFLTDFAERSGASKIHIIAHSMGNRGVLRAVNRIATAAARSTGKVFDQIILAAADVDADTFKQLYKAYNKISRRTTLYASAKDRAVGLSNWLHGYDRVGLTPPVTVLPGIDTVVVTNADVTMLGHGYVAESRGILTDIHALIKNGTPPYKRFGLQARAVHDGLKYWIIGA
ncbi:MAG: alpha/beta hydrolase [Bradyrhizobium sp.]